MSRLWLVLAFVVTCGCAHRAPNPDAIVPGDKVLLPPVAPKEVESFRVTDAEATPVVDQELETIPTDYNDRVQQWLNYFQGKGRPHMERYLSRSTRYMKIMKKILRENGLPEDLVYIALIESGFSPRATSRAAAVGYWQFIRGTGKRYGLEINRFLDERRDPILSTQAAAEYFKGLYSVFGSWYLAMASYNVGENRVKREVMNHYTRDFWELARKRRFPKETINYIPKFIAAKMIGHDPEKYGFKDIEYEKPLEFELIHLDRAVNLRQMATKMNFDYDDLKFMNPKFKGDVAPPKGNTLEIRVPLGQAQAALNAANQSYVEKMEFVADSGDTETHKVRSGESLYTIARKYRTTVALLRDLNELSPGRKLRIGMRLQVPEKGSGKKSAKQSVAVAKSSPVKEKAEDEQKATENTEVKTAEGRFYIVQPGDTLSQIADDYDSTVTELRKMNTLRRGSTLKVGMKLKVPAEDEGIPVAPDSDQVVPSRGPQAVIPIAHTVAPGDTLTSIAKKYGVTVDAIKKANNLKRRSTLKVGLRLMIPVSSSSRYGQHKNLQARYSSHRQQNKKTAKIHVVRRGENLHNIAGKYRVTVGEIREKNRSLKNSKLFVGTRLLIPEAEARTTSRQ
jgi:membrane-bound lytic murein transglycosylase D